MKYFFAFATLFFVSATSVFASTNPCYNLAKEACNQTIGKEKNKLQGNYQQSKKECEASEKSEKLKCDVDYKKARKACKALQTAKEKIEECKSQHKANLLQCKSLPGSSLSCKEEFSTCLKNCLQAKQFSKTAMISCGKTCGEVQNQCEQKGSAKETQCRRNSNRKHRQCDRKLKLQEWHTYFVCLSHALQNKLKCLWKEQETKTACFNKHWDHYQTQKESVAIDHKKCLAVSWKSCTK